MSLSREQYLIPRGRDAIISLVRAGIWCWEFYVSIKSGRKRSVRFLIMACFAAILLMACGGDEETTIGEAMGSPTASTPLDPALLISGDGPCESGRLTIAGLQGVQDEWEAGIDAAYESAVAWERDAKLVSARLSCGFLDSDTVVKATFYSDTIRTMFSSYTGETKPVDPGVPAPPQLFTEDVSFPALHDALRDAGFSEEAEIHPSSGVDVRYNGATTPFGPASAPTETVIMHLIVVQDGTVQDVFVDVEGWSVISMSDE
jgi:hypothetical protein